jgi:hypothetical protein
MLVNQPYSRSLLFSCSVVMFALHNIVLLMTTFFLILYFTQQLFKPSYLSLSLSLAGSESTQFLTSTAPNYHILLLLLNIATKAQWYTND